MNSVKDQAERKKQAQAKTMFNGFFLFCRSMTIPVRRESTNPKKDKMTKILILPLPISQVQKYFHESHSTRNEVKKIEYKSLFPV
jgi:hypothetical protein